MFLEPLDLAQMYKKHKSSSTFQNKKSEHWNKRSSEMAPRMQKSAYVEDFISKMNISKDDVILDIGCGPGTLAIPLAKKVKKVIAIDFSQSMLDLLLKYATDEGLDNIETHLLSWEDDWSKLPEVDIVVASRSMEVVDMGDTLKKINSLAKKDCYITYKVGGSFVDEEILKFIDKSIVTKPDFWYIPLLLYKDGYLPKIEYIQTNDGSVRYVDADGFATSLIWSVGELNEKQQELAREFYYSFVKCGKYTPKPTLWAFISWSK